MFKVSRVYCDKRCEGRCYGPNPFDCCHSECAAGCSGPNRNECYACKKLRIMETGDCVSECPRIKMVDYNGELTFNPNGMYQHGVTCVRKCPGN